MPYTRQVESLKSATREFANWFTVGKAMGVTAVALAASAAAYGIVGDSKDQDAAVPFIRQAGFQANTTDVSETIGGGSISIDTLVDGSCTFSNVNASLKFHDGKVDGVDNYQIPLGSNNTITVQDAAELNRVDPNLHC